MGTYGEELSVLLFPSMAACGRLATMVGELYYKNPNNEHALTHNWENRWRCSEPLRASSRHDPAQIDRQCKLNEAGP